MNLPARLLLMALFYGSAIFFAYQGDYVLAGGLVVVGMMSFTGYRMGAVYIVSSLAALGAAIYFAPSIGMAQEHRFAQWLGTSGLTNRLLAVGTVGVLMSLLISLVVIVIAGSFLARRPRLVVVNRWIGLGIGSVQGVVIVALFLGGMLILGPIEKQRARLRDPSDTRGQLISKSILAIVDRVHQSRLAPALEKFNPFTVVPGLNKVKEIQQSVAVLSDPQEIENLIHHPSVEALQKRPETRQAVDQLLSDPEIRQVLQSDQPLDARTIKRLMDHPAVLELLDQPGFVEAAYRVIQQSPINL